MCFCSRRGVCNLFDPSYLRASIVSVWPSVRLVGCQYRKYLSTRHPYNMVNKSLITLRHISLARAHSRTYVRTGTRTHTRTSRAHTRLSIIFLERRAMHQTHSSHAKLALVFLFALWLSLIIETAQQRSQQVANLHIAHGPCTVILAMCVLSKLNRSDRTNRRSARLTEKDRMSTEPRRE